MNDHLTSEEDCDLDALGALEGDEKQLIESHIASCANCARKLAEARGRVAVVSLAVPAGEVYQAVESPRGEVGCYMVSDGTQKPYRVHWRGPSFGNLQAIPKMIEGTLIADVIAGLGVRLSTVAAENRNLTQGLQPTTTK